MYVYGGQYCRAGGSMVDSKSCDNFDVLELQEGVWDSLALVGTPPGKLQEMCAVTLDGQRSVVWGGYAEWSACSRAEMQLEADHANEGKAGSPEDATCCYKKSAYVYEAGVWHPLRKIGHDSAHMAQGWGIPTSEETFIVIGGYGLTSTSGMDALSGHTPENLIAHYSVKIQGMNPEKSSSDCWGKSAPFLYRKSVYDGCRDAGPFTEVEEYQELSQGVELFHMWTVVSQRDPDKVDMNRDTYFGPLAEYVEVELKRAEAEMSAVRAAEGTNGSWSPYRTAVLSRPRAAGPLFNPVGYMTAGKSTHLSKQQIKQQAEAADLPQTKAMVRIQAEQERVQLPKAVAYAAQLSAWSQPAALNFLSIRIELTDIEPRIYRDVRVAARITLAELHDYVICSIFGYVRGYHAYAFRQDVNSPWLGPVTSTAMDMAHIPFYVGALTDDRKVKLGSLLSTVGQTLEYVHDLGDWWRHRITCQGVHDDVPTEADAEMATAEVVSGAMNGPPMDIGGALRFTHKVNLLLGCVADPDTEAQASTAGVHRFVQNATNLRPLTPQDEKWWDVLNDDFRRAKARCECAPSVHYDPFEFDLGRINADLQTALRSGRRNPKDDHKQYMQQSSIGNGLMMERDVNLKARTRTAKKTCAVCGSAAALKACSRCKAVHYCCKEHQLEHWKSHKADCNKRQVK